MSRVADDRRPATHSKARRGSKQADNSATADWMRKHRATAIGGIRDELCQAFGFADAEIYQESIEQAVKMSNAVHKPEKCLHRVVNRGSGEA